MRTGFVLIALMSLGHFAYSQDPAGNVPRQAIKFSPLNLAGTFPTLDFSFEQRIYGRFTAQVGYGVVLNYSSFDTEENNRDISARRGHKMRGEVRYYLFKETRVLPYFAAEYVRNFIRYDKRIVSRGCFDPICAFTYEKRADYLVKLNEEGANVKFGFVTYIKRKVIVDINAGFRYRNLDFNESDLPSPGERINSNGFEGLFANLYDEEEDREVLRLVIGVRLGYRFR